jgi:hypothetical protein
VCEVMYNKCCILLESVVAIRTLLLRLRLCVVLYVYSLHEAHVL